MSEKSLIRKKKGVVLILASIIVAALLAISGGYMKQVVAELNTARRFLNNEKSLWAAEAGAVVAYCNLKTNANWNPASLSASDRQVGDDGSFAITVTLSGSDRNVSVAATIGNLYPKTVTFSLSYPGALSNALSAGKKLRRRNTWGQLNINGDTQAGNGVHQTQGYWKLQNGELEYVITSEQNNLSWVTTHQGYSYDWNANPAPEILFPDGDDQNGVDDQFTDFTSHFQNTINSNQYSASEVVYIQINNNDTVWVYPGWSGQGYLWTPSQGFIRDAQNNTVTLSGKKILYVEGNSAGKGDVKILFGAAEVYGQGEDLTIISTGDVSYIAPVQIPGNNSRLNVIAWNNYEEWGSWWYGNNHNSNVFAHDNVIYSGGTSNTTGSVTANDNIELGSWYYGIKYINSPTLEVELPPGFEGLSELSQGNIFSSGGSGTLNNDWQEL